MTITKKSIITLNVLSIIGAIIFDTLEFNELKLVFALLVPTSMLALCLLYINEERTGSSILTFITLMLIPIGTLFKILHILGADLFFIVGSVGFILVSITMLIRELKGNQNLLFIIIAALIILNPLFFIFELPWGYRLVSNIIIFSSVLFLMLKGSIKSSRTEGYLLYVGLTSLLYLFIIKIIQ